MRKEKTAGTLQSMVRFSSLNCDKSEETCKLRILAATALAKINQSEHMGPKRLELQWSEDVRLSVGPEMSHVRHARQPWSHKIVDRIASEHDCDARLIELVDHAPDLFPALTPNKLTGVGREIVDVVEAADLLVIGTPVYRDRIDRIAEEAALQLSRRDTQARRPASAA